MDTSIVKVYKQLGDSPNPNTDELLGTDTTFNDGIWEIDTSGWSEGRYKIYAVGWDKAGNQSGYTVRDIGVLPVPMRVSGLVNWHIGELNQITIGEVSDVV
ncbi:MAG: hypothetical protein H0Z28_11210 [Archaeoglobus sp.]|nr:hypothetical protein [Archaeoglobus sp.]